MGWNPRVWAGLLSGVKAKLSAESPFVLSALLEEA